MLRCGQTSLGLNLCADTLHILSILYMVYTLSSDLQDWRPDRWEMRDEALRLGEDKQVVQRSTWQWRRRVAHPSLRASAQSPSPCSQGLPPVVWHCLCQPCRQITLKLVSSLTAPVSWAWGPSELGGNYYPTVKTRKLRPQVTEPVAAEPEAGLTPPVAQPQLHSLELWVWLSSNSSSTTYSPCLAQVNLFMP